MTSPSASANAHPKNGFSPTGQTGWREKVSTHGHVVLASLTVNMLSLSLPIALLQVYDRILPNRSFGTISALIIGVSIALCLEAVIRLARYQLMGRLGARFEYRAGLDAFRKMMTSDLAAFERVGPGEHLERFNSISGIRDFYSGQAMVNLYDLPFAMLYLSAIWYLGGLLVLVPVVSIAFTVLMAPVIGRSLAVSLGKQRKAENRRYDFVISAISGIFSVKALSSEVLLSREYEKLQEARLSTQEIVERKSIAVAEWAATLSQFTLLAVVVTGTLLVMDESLSVGALAACTLLTGRTMQPVQGAVGLWTRFQGIPHRPRPVSQPDVFAGRRIRSRQHRRRAGRRQDDGNQRQDRNYGTSACKASTVRTITF